MADPGLLIIAQGLTTLIRNIVFFLLGSGGRGPATGRRVRWAKLTVAVLAGGGCRCGDAAEDEDDVDGGGVEVGVRRRDARGEEPVLSSWEEDEEMVECLLLGLDDGSLNLDRREKEKEEGIGLGCL